MKTPNVCESIDTNKQLDLYRDTPVRYLGYANEVGEAFRSIIGRKLVNLSYIIATLYVFADTTDKSYKTFKKFDNLTKTAYITTDTLLWQLLASIIIPGFTINRVCLISNSFIEKNYKNFPKNRRKLIVTSLGLITIPFIIKPIDKFVDLIMDKSFRKLSP